MTTFQSHVGIKVISHLVAVIFLFVGVQMSAQAAIVSTDSLVAEAQLNIKRDEINSFLSREDVRNELIGLGVDPSHAQERVNSLSETEILSLHDQLATLPAGGDALGTIALVLIILILLDVAGVTDIFPGV